MGDERHRRRYMGHGGVASDGTNIFAVTGNTFHPPNWSGGEAMIRLQAGPIFGGNPTNTGCRRIGSPSIIAYRSWRLGPLLVDVPGATPSRLALALGKDGNAHLLNRVISAVLPDR